MKNSFIYKSMIALVAIFMLGSCSDLFEHPLIKTNPNSPEDASIDKVMTGGLTGFAERMEDTDVRIPMMWSGHLTGLSRQHLGFAQYIVSSGSFGAFSFANPYNVAAQMRIVQQKAAKLNTKRMLGAAQVIEAIIIAKETCLYGDVPYTEAFDPDKFPKPKYDKMSDVYASLQTTLSTAIANLSLPAVPDGGTITGDFLYNGSNTKWIAAANTLKARLYLHTGAYANAVTSALAGINSSSGDMLIPHGSSYAVDQNLNNVFFDINRPADAGCEPPTVLPDLMLAHTKLANGVATNESRLWEHYFQNPGIYTGNTDPNTVDGFFQPASPHPAITFFENMLILAEAYARQSDLPNALIALNSVRAELSTGIMYTQSMPARGTLSYDPFVIGDFTTPTAQVALLSEILTTKYILMFGQLEVYNDLRRCQKATPIVQVMNLLGTKAIASDPIVSTPTGRIPDRYIYPQNQINTNPNVPKTASGSVADQYQKLEIFN